MQHLTLFKLRFVDIDDCGESYYIYEDVWAVDYNHAIRYLADKYEIDLLWIESCEV